MSLRNFSLLALAVVILDQVTKLIVVATLADGSVVTIVPNYLQLVYRTNTGGAFSILSEHLSFLTIFATVVAIGLMIWAYRLRANELILRLPLALILGGACGNLVDRYRLHYVVDFIDAHWNFVRHFPTFNVADMSINVGMAIMIWLTLRMDTGEEKAEAPSQAD